MFYIVLLRIDDVDELHADLKNRSQIYAKRGFTKITYAHTHIRTYVKGITIRD